MAEGDRGYANVFFGLSVPDLANTTTHSVYGFTGGSRVFKEISLGGYHAISSTETATGTIPFRYSLTGLESRYYVASGATNVFVGVRAGITKIYTTTSGSNIIFSPYHYGVVSGYNFKLWSELTVGFEGNLMFISGDSVPSGSANIDHNAFTTINFFLTSGISF